MLPNAFIAKLDHKIVRSLLQYCKFHFPSSSFKVDGFYFKIVRNSNDTTTCVVWEIETLLLLVHMAESLTSDQCWFDKNKEKMNKSSFEKP